ncbi:conserved hypothetical protein, partial [Ricinus communis]
MLQQHDGLAVYDAAPLHVFQRRAQRHFQHLHVLAFVFKAAAFAHAHRGVVLAHVEVQLFRHGAGAHERFKNFADVVDAVAGLFLRLGANALFR